MFESTARFALFDYFRVPYEFAPRRFGASAGIETLNAEGSEAALRWPATTSFSFASGRATAHFLGSIPIFGRVVGDAEMRAWTRLAGGSWTQDETVRDERGTLVSAVWRRADGSTLLPFDPSELISNFWTEEYLELQRTALTARLASLSRRGYYWVRPVLPRGIQMTLRRSFSRVQSKKRFPRWPVETALHDLYDFLFERVIDLADRPVPFIRVWPGEWDWALVLTHDVEGRTGYANVHSLLDVELESGYRSSWNFVPKNGYSVEDALLAELRGEGFEIGVHGLFHDGRDISSPASLRRRLPAIRSYAERWRASGFRSPGTIRSATLMPLLGFDYDSSYSDTAPFEPQAGGCCTWLPYMIENMVELPITLVQDHTLFDLLRHRDETLWVEKARLLRERGGMALILTHSDYVGNPHLVESYRRFLAEFASDSSAWKALPREVSGWWRRRSESTLHEVDGEWRVAGPAEDEARVDFATTPWLRV